MAPLTYVYALIRTPRPPTLDDVPPGVPGSGPIRALAVPATAGARRAGRLWLIVSSVPAGEYGEAAVQGGLQHMDWVGRRALAHEAVVESFLDATAVLPMQLFTLFTSDERALAHVARDRRRIDRILARVERHLEWGLRLTWDVGEAGGTAGRAGRTGKAGTGGRAARGGDEAGVGAAYLARKRDLIDASRVQLTAARASASRVYRTLAREASASRRRTVTEQAVPGSRLLLDAAYLVPVRRNAGFRAAVRRAARSLEGTGIAVSLTGPWPPYNFL